MISASSAGMVFAFLARVKEKTAAKQNQNQ
jgi:hypothetical protein